MRRLLSGYLACFLLLALSAQAAENCAQTLHSLAERQRLAAREASSKGYTVTALRGEVDGIERTLVILGETHVKDKRAKQLGQKVIREFELIGVEGADASKMWGGRFFSWTVDTLFFLRQLISFGVQNESTSIDDADLRARVIRKALKASAQYHEGKLSRDAFRRLTLRVHKKERLLLELLAEQGIEESQVLEGTLSPVEVIPLEEGHRPGFAENLQSLLVPATLAACVTGLCSAAVEYALPDNPVTPMTKLASMGFALFNGTLVAVGEIMGRLFPQAPWLRYLLSLQFSLVDGRNETMAGNILNAFRDKPGQATMLAIVGQRHVDGLRALLERRGFRPQPL